MNKFWFDAKNINCFKNGSRVIKNLNLKIAYSENVILIGPNGSGKSNVVEAIKWVMGENSSKNLRGSGMNDLIFSGSASKASKNIALVSITLEVDKIILEDFDIISEMSTFVQHGQSFQAEEGHHDDLMMCCVLFAWLTGQTYFKELTNSDIRARLFEESQSQIEQDMAPFGFVVDGINDPEEETVDEYGNKWSTVVRKYDTNW